MNNKNVINLKYDELPKTISSVIPKINKIIINKIEEIYSNDKYKSLLEDDRFDLKNVIKAISDRNHDNDVAVGVITKKSSNSFEAMIQITGHVPSPNKTDNEKLFHALMLEVYKELKPIIDKEFQMDLSHNDFKEHGVEGFDVYTTPDIAKSIWNFHHKTDESLNESLFIEFTEILSSDNFVFQEGTKVDEIMDKIKVAWNKFINLILRALRKVSKKMFKTGKESYTVESILTINEMIDSSKKLAPTAGDADASASILLKIETMLNRKEPIKVSVVADDIKRLEGELEKLTTAETMVAGAMMRGYIDGPLWDQWRHDVGRLSAVMTKFIGSLNPSVKSNINESVSSEYNTDMTEAESKKTLRTLTQSLINDFDNDKNKKMTQYTANIYANIITKNLLPRWAKGFNKFRITLDSYQSFATFEFITPTMGQDFVARFINGRESLNGFIHRSPEIRVKMSPRIFHTLKNPDDAYNFFKSAIQYYDSKLEKSGNKLVVEIMKLGHNMKHLVANSKLSGLVTYPLSLLFVFDDVNMTNRDTFKVSDEDITSVNKFVKNIATRYAAPEKEKKQIVEDVKKMVQALKESCEASDTMRDLYHFPEAVEKFLFEGYNNEIMESSRLFIEGQIDREWNPSPQVAYYKESWGVKKLKKIPKDLIPYIQIETEAIRDANDKMILSSYTLGKIEIVEWYIELLTVGSKKYIVPHTKPYLETIRTALLQCFKKIMDVQVSKRDRPIIDIKYPAGYEG